MADSYDAVVIGAGLGGLTAAALLARAGRKTLLIERHPSVGGAASTYQVGDLMVEASLHETSDPFHPADPKHAVLKRLGVLDAVNWVPVGSLYEVRGGPVGAPFLLPDSFAAAHAALNDRFPAARRGIAAVLGEMERMVVGLGALNRGRMGLTALRAMVPLARHWRQSLDAMFARHFGDDEAVKCALAANLPYYHDDPADLWWIAYAVAQGGYLLSGGYYVRGGSQRLSDALAGAFTAAGGELLLGRTATTIRLDRDGAPTAVIHDDGTGGDVVEVAAAVVVGNAAPPVLGAMLPEAARTGFLAPYAGQALSISLFSATFGLSVRPAELGLKAYSTFLLPSWMRTLGQYRDCGALFGGLPGERVPAMVVADYSAIESGLGGPPYPVSVVGTDRLANWDGLDQQGYEERRARWRDAIVTAIDAAVPGFAAHVVAEQFATARSLARYLNTPSGAVYGFAPLTPAAPIWRGMERTAKTAIPGVLLASSYAGAGGFTGAISSGAQAADLITGRLRQRTSA